MLPDGSRSRQAVVYSDLPAAPALLEMGVGMDPHMSPETMNRVMPEPARPTPASQLQPWGMKNPPETGSFHPFLGYAGKGQGPGEGGVRKTGRGSSSPVFP